MHLHQRCQRHRHQRHTSKQASSQRDRASRAGRAQQKSSRASKASRASRASRAGRALERNSGRRRDMMLTRPIPAQKVFCIFAYNMSAGGVSNCPAHTQAYVSICLVAKSPSEKAVSNCLAYTKPNVSNFRALLNIYYYITIGHPQLLTARGGLRRDAPCARSLGGERGVQTRCRECKNFPRTDVSFRAPVPLPKGPRLLHGHRPKHGSLGHSWTYTPVL